MTFNKSGLWLRQNGVISSQQKNGVLPGVSPSLQQEDN